VPSGSRRSDRCGRAGAGRHCCGGNWGGQLEWWNRDDPRLNDRRAHHGRTEEWLQPDGLVDLGPGNHNRGCDCTGGGDRQIAPAQKRLARLSMDLLVKLYDLPESAVLLKKLRKRGIEI